MKLRTKFALGLLVVTLVLSGATVGGLELFKDQQVDRVRGDVDETATQTAGQLETELADRRDYIGYIAGRNQTADFDQSEQVLSGLLDNSRFRNALLVDANGTVVDARGAYTDAERTDLLGSNVTGGPCVSEPLSTGDHCISDPQPANDGYAIVISAPVFREGDVAGALVGVIRVTDTTFLSVLDPLETSSQSVTITHEDETLYGGHTEFESAVAATATVDGVGWRVRVERDRSTLQSRLQQLALAQGLGLFVVLNLVVGFGYWEYSVNLRQTNRLLSGFRRLQSGEYDLSLSLSSGEEWEQISDGFNDMTDGLKQREEQLREREQRLEVLNRVMRHNVRNEMVVVLNYAELVSDFADDDQVEEMADTIYDTGQKLANLSDKAQEIESVTGDDHDPQRVDLAAVARDTVADAGDRFGDVTLETELPASAPVTALPTVRRGVENVVENACKHNDADDPRVTVRVETVANEGERRLVVVDNGPGVPEQERAVLEKGRETALEHGSGLGLWLVYWVVDGSGGTLDIADNDPRGSVVSMTFERRENEELPAEQEGGRYEGDDSGADGREE